MQVSSMLQIKFAINLHPKRKLMVCRRAKTSFMFSQLTERFSQF